MTIAVSTLARRTPSQLRAFVRAQHVEVERHPEGVTQADVADSTYWRYLVFRTALEGICVHYYQTYDASGDENDWNLNIAPGSAYRWLLDPGILQALSLFSGAPSLLEPCSVKCKEGYQVIEAELTPDNGLYDKFLTGGLPISAGSWWPKKDENQGEGPTGIRVGVYGVFCGDYGHGGRPEIHPFDAFWRQRHDDGRAASISWDLGIFQDDSNRFNGDWSQPPVDVEFRVPFCVDVPISTRTSITSRAAFVLARSDLCSVVGGRTRAAGGRDFVETFTARTVRLNPRLENRVEMTIRDNTGLGGRPFTLALDELRFTSTRGIGPFVRRAWLSGLIVIRAAVEQDGFVYWNLSGPNSTSATDAGGEDSLPDVPAVADPVLDVARPRLGAAERRVARVVEATPRVVFGPSPSIEVDIRVETTGADGIAEDRGQMTVGPRETPWLFDATGGWSELETFDMFAVPAIEHPPARADGRRRQRRLVDIGTPIGHLAGLERRGRRVRYPDATVEIEDEVVVVMRHRYVPWRDGEVMGEERSLLSDRLNNVDTGPLTVRADVWVTGRRTHRYRIAHRAAGDVAEDGPVRLDTSADSPRLVVSGLGQDPAVVRFDVSLHDQFGLRSDVSALVGNFHVADARTWVEAACGVSVAVVRRRLLHTAELARSAPSNAAIAGQGLLRTLAEALTELDAHDVVPATRVAGAVRLALRVKELVPER